MVLPLGEKGERTLGKKKSDLALSIGTNQGEPEGKVSTGGRGESITR